MAFFARVSSAWLHPKKEKPLWITGIGFWRGLYLTVYHTTVL